jgi:hypothetical protein
VFDEERPRAVFAHVMPTLEVSAVAAWRNMAAAVVSRSP